MRVDCHGTMQRRISLVMPVYNEAKAIEKVVRDCHEKLIKKLPGSEFIIAEDGSTDGTKEILRRLAKEMPLRVVMGDERKGYPRGIRDALKLPKNDIVCFSDSDGQHDPSDFLKMLDYVDRYDIIIGMKKPRRDPFHRLVLSRAYNSLIRLLFGLRFKDIDSGFRVIRKKVLDDVLDKSTTLPECTNSEITIRAAKKGYRIIEVPVTHYPRAAGDTKSFNFRKLPKVVHGLFRGLLKLKSDISSAK